MEIVKELVAPALQRADIDADRTSRRYDLFTMQRRALELGRDGLLVADRQFHLGAGRNFHLGRHKSVILDRNRDRTGIGRGREGAEQRKKGGKGKRAHLQKPAIDNRSQDIEGKPQPQPEFAQPECAKSPLVTAALPAIDEPVPLPNISAITVNTAPGHRLTRWEERCWILA